MIGECGLHLRSRQRPGKKRRPPRRRRLSDAIARICTHVCMYGRQGVALHTTPRTQEIASHDKPACEDPHRGVGLAQQTRTRTSSNARNMNCMLLLVICEAGVLLGKSGFQHREYCQPEHKRIVDTRYSGRLNIDSWGRPHGEFCGHQCIAKWGVAWASCPMEPPHCT
jgi:hypothetical protein